MMNKKNGFQTTIILCKEKTMAIDYELLRKKAKKRDEEKQKKDNYEYSKSMYEGAT